MSAPTLGERLHEAQRISVDAEEAVARAVRLCEAVLHPAGADMAKKEAARFLQDYAPSRLVQVSE